MLIQRKEMTRGEIENCHDGKGKLTCVTLFAEYGREDPGLKFAHEDVLEPGASIGAHRHEGDDELYIILDGHGTARIDGEEVPVERGDALLTRSGHSHALVNSYDGDMRLLVVCANR